MINGGFGLVLDGSEEAGQRAKLMLNWDVSNGVSISMCVFIYTLIILLYINTDVYIIRLLGDAGLATLMLMTQFNVPWRTSVSWESQCPTQYRKIKFWTVHCKDRLISNWNMRLCIKVQQNECLWRNTLSHTRKKVLFYSIRLDNGMLT